MANKALKTVVACGALLGATASLSGCNQEMWDEFNRDFGYIVIHENDHDVLHKIEKWADSSSESFTITTDCCHNYIWGSVNNATLYKELPEDYTYDMVCPHLELHE